MKKLLGMSLPFLAALSLSAVQVGNTVQEVQQEKGLPPGRMIAGGFVILSYPDQTIRIQDGRVVRLSGPPARLSIVPAPKPKPKPRPMPAWKDDFDTAFAQAREQNRHVLLFFTGPDWGQRGARLEKEVLSTTEFVEYANANLVLVKIDFSGTAIASESSVPETPPPLPTRNASSPRLAKSDDVPMIFVLDSDGHPAGSFHYPESGPGPFIDALKKL